jgi:membrane protein
VRTLIRRKDGQRVHEPNRWSDRARRVQTRAVDTRAELERRLPVITATTQRLLSANVIDAGFRLAAQTFLTAMPLLFTAAAFAPEGAREQLLTTVRTVFGINESTAAELRQLLESEGGAIRQTVGVIGLVMALLSATSLSRALARICERAWALPKSPTRIAAWRWVIWIAVWVTSLFFQGPIRNGFGVGAWLGALAGGLTNFVLWSWTQHLLLAGRKTWAAVVPGGILAAVAATTLALTARLYMPYAIGRSLQAYGPLGAVFSLLTWLVVVCMTITVALTIGAVLAEHPPLDRFIHPSPAPVPAPSPAASTSTIEPSDHSGT